MGEIMEYEYDIFVSYKRYGEWTNWVRGEFYNVLRDHLAMELGDDPKIFIDNQLESGTDWPSDLARKLTTSRVLVPLFSKMYFGSEWCLKEFYAARFKEDQIGLRTPQRSSGIIVPARIHDGTENDLPAHLQECCRVHAEDFTEYAITSLRRNSPRFESFEEKVKTWVKQSVKPAIDRTAGTKPEQTWLTRISNQEFRCPPPASFERLRFPSLA